MKKQIGKLLLFTVLPGMSIVSCSKNDTSIEQLNPAIESQRPAESDAEVIENIRNVPIDAIFFNECCNEEVHAFGTAHIVVTNNIIHVVVSDLTGTGLSTGYSYQGRGASTQERTFPSEPNGIFVLRLNMTNGDDCSFRLKITFLIAVNANGDITASIDRITTNCY